MDMRIAVILPAAGSATRYAAAGGLRHKIDEDLGGKIVLQRAIELFTRFEPDDATIASIIVAGPHDDAAFADFKARHADRLGLLGATLCKGGATHRWETVRAALAHVPADCTHIAVHDAVRPCASEAMLARVFRAAAKHAAVIPAVESPDTLKRTRTDDSAIEEPDPLAAILGAAKPEPRRTVTETLDRAGVVLVQTPQVFRADVLRAAYAQTDLSGTDDAQVVERFFASRGKGEAVVVVEGDARNIKITRPADLELARAILGVRAAEERSAMRKF